MTRRTGVQPARARRAGLPRRAAHAPVRDLHHAAHPRQGAEHQAQLRVALRGRRVARRSTALIQPRETTREGRRPERTVYEITAAGVDGARGLAGRAALDARARVHLARGRALADAGPAARRGRRACSTHAPSGCGCELRAVDADARSSRAMGLPELFVVESHVPEAHAAGRARRSSTELAARIRSDDARRHRPSGGACTSCAPRGMSFEEIIADPVGHLGEEARAAAARERLKHPRPVRQHRPGAITRAGP